MGLSLSVKHGVRGFLSVALVFAAGCSVNSGTSSETGITPPAENTASTVQAYTVTPGAPWVARHGMTAADYQTEFNTMVAQGYRLTYVSGYAVNGQALYAAIWEKSSGAAWVAKHGLTAAQYQTEFNTQAAAGYHLVLVNGYTVNGVDYYAALWDKSSVGPWEAHHGMSAAQYQTTFNTLVAQGYRLRHVSGYGANGNQEFAAIWEKASGPAWIAKNGLTAAQYQAEFNAQVAAGYHLTLVNGYPVGNDVRYVAIWEQGGVAPWQAHHGMSSADYQQTFNDLRYQGYRPAMVSGYGTPDGAEYAALWLNYSYSAADLNHIDSVVNGVMNTSAAPGISIAIAKEGRLVFAKGYGLADKSANRPVTTASLFRIASVSKTFTSTGIMKLVEAGKIHLTDKVFGPGSILGTTFTANPHDARINQITVQEVLTHTSGLWSNQANDPMFENYAMSRSQLITWALETLTLPTTPGTAYAYSNFGFLILGRVIEKVTGQDYDVWMKANVLGPSGISDMQIGGSTEAERAPNEVTYYSAGNPADPYSIDVSRMDSHGGWIATPIDLVRFAVRMDGFSPPADLVSAASETEMMTPTALSGNSYGFGWAITGTNWWHNGSLPGTTSIMVRTATQFTWSAITNTRDNSPNVDTMMWNVVNGVSAWPTYDLF